MHDPVHKLTPLCDGLTEHLVVSDVPGSTAICGRCTWHAQHQLVSGSLHTRPLRPRRNSTGVRGAVHATLLSRPMHVSHASVVAFKTYLAIGTLPTHLASRNARTAQRQCCTCTVSRRIRGGSFDSSFSSDACSAPSDVEHLAYSCRVSFCGPKK